MRHLFLALAAALAAAGPASAGKPVTETMTCPIGGGSFTFTTAASYSTYGERPDGRPFGSWTFPLALPECPDNGLVLYKEYTAEEVAKLEPLVASEAYQALRKDGHALLSRLLADEGDGPRPRALSVGPAPGELGDRGQAGAPQALSDRAGRGVGRGAGPAGGPQLDRHGGPGDQRFARARPLRRGVGAAGESAGRLAPRFAATPPRRRPGAAGTISSPRSSR